MSIEGKIAIVTGGANGIGFCTARKLLRNGAKAVALLDLSDSGGESAAADLNNEFGKDRAIFIACDVSKNEQFQESFKKVIDTYETLNILVNIAGIMDDADWEIMVDINYKGIVYGTILGLHTMGKYKGGNGGIIVNMSSVAGLEGIPIAPIYGGTQYAIVGFTQSLKHYYEKTGIRMLTICPGLTTTAMAARFMSTKEHAMDLLDEETAAMAMVTMQKQPPEHVASAIIQLIEQGANGAIFVIENNQPPYAVEFPSYTTLKIMTDNIKNKTALITGGTVGLGLIYAKRLLENGAKCVALLDLSSSPGQQTVNNLEKEFGKGKAIFYACDVSNINEFEAVFKKVVNDLNGLDIVINNAGIYNDKKWEQTMCINVGGVIQGSLLAFDHMSKLKGGKGGTIVNIASIVALDIIYSNPVYCASKHFVLAFSRSLARYYNNTGIRILIMCPGVTTTSLLENPLSKSFDFVTQNDFYNCLGKDIPQTPEHVGNAMVKLIEKGKNEAVWVCKEGKQPYAVEFPPLKKIELQLKKMQIKDKRVIITGVASGLGLTISRELLRNGASIIAMIDAEESGKETVDILNKEFGRNRTIFYHCNIANNSEFDDTFKKAVKALGGLEILVNNADVTNETDFMKTIDVNVTSVIRATLLGIQQMQKDLGGKGGAIVNISSLAGLYAAPQLPVYSATKHAVVSFSRSFAQPYHYKRTGVKILVMCPELPQIIDVKNLENIPHDDVIQKYFRRMLSIAHGLVYVLRCAQNGSIWISENGKPVYEIQLFDSLPQKNDDFILDENESKLQIN
ncbi:uncharacterized protein LOC724838 [Apis mellifera]|uniref:Uncharacterized protein LOC724838 n=1 Tax=Apis mellifera TaxID=7460 RepID=A0A7M7MPS8_APIME|nr:uncharacterized protein LOC724838 [Apis mellifera]|eukprot:XP_026299150.1 uncharacterized protein LOC724838 [Apis mellifera]